MITWWREIAIAAALALVGLQSMRLANEERAHANTKTAHAVAAADAERARAKESEKARAEEARRDAERQKEVARAQDQRRAALAAAARADRAADGLREQLADFVSRARAAAADSTAAGRGEAAAAPVVVLADLLGRLDARAGELAKAVDAAHGAGISCERSADALTP